jgi:hypothetical protein
MTDKRKKNEEEEELFDLQDYGIKEDELKDIISMNEKGNLHVLRHRTKEINNALSKIEDGLFDIVFEIDELLEDYQEGKIFARDASDAIEKLFTLAEFTKGMENEFRKMKSFVNE